jgi:hypothetical protein
VNSTTTRSGMNQDALVAALREADRQLAAVTEERDELDRTVRGVSKALDKMIKERDRLVYKNGYITSALYHIAAITHSYQQRFRAETDPYIVGLGTGYDRIADSVEDAYIFDMEEDHPD